MEKTRRTEALRMIELGISELLDIELQGLPDDARAAVESTMAENGKLSFEIELPSYKIEFSIDHGHGLRTPVFEMPGDPGRRFFPPIPKTEN